MIHRQQFAILKKRIDLPGYKSIDMEDGWVLSYHEDLPVYLDKKSQTFLLGYAWQVLPERGTPEEELKKLAEAGNDHISESELLNCEESWNGRYVVISGGRVYLDANGMLNVFFSDAGLSSDCLLLARVMGYEEKIYTPGTMNWMPGMLTHYEGIRHLMPSQIYDYRNRAVYARELLPGTFIQGKSEEDLTDQFIECFCHSLKQMEMIFPDQRLMVALTGGYESRTLAALAKKAGTDFMAYTMEFDTIEEGDVEIPPKICETLGIGHVYVERDRSNYSKEREEEYIRYICGLVRDEDRLYYAYDQFRDLTKTCGRCVLLRSGIWPNLAYKYSRFFDNNRPADELYQEYHIDAGSLEWDSLHEYFTWCEEHPEKRLDLANRFYHEVRSGCWLAYIEQGFTMLDDVISLEPVNSRVLLSILAAFSEESRLGKRHQTLITGKACPQLSGIPYGNSINRKGSFASLRSKARRASDRLRQMGFRNAVQLYVKIIREHYRIWILKRKH